MDKNMILLVQIFVLIIISLSIYFQIRENKIEKKRVKQIIDIFNNGGILENKCGLTISKSLGYKIHKNAFIKDSAIFYIRISDCIISDCVENKLLLGTIIL